MTAKEARKILGISSDQLTNEEIDKLVSDMAIIARIAIGRYLVRKRDL